MPQIDPSIAAWRLFGSKACKASTNCCLQGSGPLGLPGPGSVQQFVAQLQASAARVWPQIRGLIDTPGAVELRSELVGALSRRFVARTIKLIFGSQVGGSARFWMKTPLLNGLLLVFDFEDLASPNVVWRF